MPEIVLALARIGFLVLLWLFVFLALRVIRTDLFGTRASRVAAPPPAAAAPRSGKPARRRRTPRQLVVTQGALAGTKISLTDMPITIGRADDSTLVLTDDYASSRHARLMQRDGQWLVEDLGSTNGTYLDRSKVTGPTPVQPGAPIRIGKTTLELRT